MMIFSQNYRTEAIVLVFVLTFLWVNAFFNATLGFSLPLYLGTIPLAALLAFFFPRAGFVAAFLTTMVFERFFTLEPLIVGDTLYKLYPLDVILGVSLFSGLLLFLSRRRERSRFRSPDIWLSLFFLFVTVLFCWTLFSAADVSVAVAFSAWKHYVFYGLIVFFITGMLRSREDLLVFLKLFFVGLGVASIFLVIGVVRGEGLWTEYTPLSTAGTRFLAFPHAFYFSLGLVILLLSLPYWLERKERARTWMLLLGSAVLGAGVLGSLMRHLWLGIGGVLVWALVISPATFGRLLVRYGVRFLFPIALVLVSLVLWVTLSPSGETTAAIERGSSVVKERILSIGNESDESFAWRGEVWSSALERFGARPWFGLGFGASVPIEMGDYQQYVEVRNIHNSWLALLIQTGLVGVLLFGGFLSLLLWSLVRLSLSDAFLRQARFVLAGLLFFEGLVFLSQPYLETNLLGIFFWTTLGVMRAMVEFSSPQENKGVSRREV